MEGMDGIVCIGELRTNYSSTQWQMLATWAKIRRPRLQQGERVRGGITSSKGQEVITSSKGKKQENKKEEARSKKQLQATSGKKQETRSQEATSGWKTGH